VAGRRPDRPDGRAAPAAIRRAAPRDLDRLAALWSGLAAHHEAIDPLFRRRPDAAPRIRELLRRQLADPDAALFVAEVEGDLVAFCGVRIDRAPPILEETERVEITDVAVREDQRRRGIGRALAQTALDWASQRGLRRVEVRVAARNAEGQAFWRALGFGAFVDVLDRRL
jgi:ribosomal protein S18 acetylase RimI-like enzyme